MKVETIFDNATFTLTYIVYQNNEAIIIDPVLDYDQSASRISTESVDKVCDFLKSENLTPVQILETHAHADHLTGAQELKKRYPGLNVGIGKNISVVQKRFKGIYNLKNLKTDASQFDLLLDEGKTERFGSMEVKVIFTPGHTPACSSYLIGKNLFTGDALFMPDYGTGRCDFPDGSAEDLYHSVHEKLYKLADDIMTYTGHDYQPGGRELRFCAPLKEQKETNIHIKTSTTKAEYIKFRTERDATLSAPKLLLPSIQVNIDGGRLPDPEDNGTSYLKIPVS